MFYCMGQIIRETYSEKRVTFKHHFSLCYTLLSFKQVDILEPLLTFQVWALKEMISYSTL